MKYNTEKLIEAQNAREYLDKLICKKAPIDVREIKGPRNLDQNALYWVFMTMIENATGMKKEQVHYLYRGMKLRKPDEEITAWMYPELWERVKKHLDSFHYFDGLDNLIDMISYSTTSLDTSKFTWYLNEIKSHAWENMEIELITLEDQRFREFYNENKNYFLTNY